MGEDVLASGDAERALSIFDQLAEMAPEHHAVVSGRVQGVFFRASTREVAIRHGVHGFVRNLPGRELEAVLQGERPALERVVAFMREGPPGAVVSDLALEWRNPGERYEGFRVLY